MANTATLVQNIPCNFSPGGFSRVKQYKVTFDTLTSDLTIFTPSSGKRAAVLGLIYGEASAHGLIWKSGATTLLTLEMPANTVVNQGIGLSNVSIITSPGEALIAQVTTAVISSMLVYVAEFGAEGLSFTSNF